MIGPQTLNLSFAYGITSVPLVAAKYNMLISETYAFNGVPQKGYGSGFEAVHSFLSRKIAPGFLWSFLRDSGSVGGSIAIGPVLSAKVVETLGLHEAQPDPLVRFGSGLLTGSLCGLATQGFHNGALTAGRMMEAGVAAGPLTGLSQAFREHGPRMLYMNIQFRVGVIAAFSAILNVAEPFRGI